MPKAFFYVLKRSMELPLMRIAMEGMEETDVTDLCSGFDILL